MKVIPWRRDLISAWIAVKYTIEHFIASASSSTGIGDVRIHITERFIRSHPHPI